MSSPEEPFRFLRDVDVRYSDVDAAGHVHHAAALLYFEEARAAYWRDVVGRPSLADIDYVLAEACVRWHVPIEWPQTVVVGVRVAHVGRKHFRMEYEVGARDGRRLVTGHTVQVMYDYAAGTSKPIPDPVRAALERVDGSLADDA